MNWFIFFATMAWISGPATAVLGLLYFLAWGYNVDTKSHHNWLIGLFIFTVITGAIAGGLS